jgi:hypothetical protein
METLRGRTVPCLTRHTRSPNAEAIFIEAPKVLNSEGEYATSHMFETTRCGVGAVLQAFPIHVQRRRARQRESLEVRMLLSRNDGVRM